MVAGIAGAGDVVALEQELDRFPTSGVVAERLRVAEEYFLRLRRQPETKNDSEQIKKYLLYTMGPHIALLSARDPNYPWANKPYDEKRRQANRLRELLGDDEYLKGRLPPPLPVTEKKD